MNSHELVFKRNIFYFNLMRMQFLLMLMLLLGVCFNSYFINEITLNYRRPVYFMSDDYGKLIKDYPKDNPLYDDASIVAWTSQALKGTFETDFVNYEERIKSAGSFFNELGFVQFIKALKVSRNLKAVTDMKYVTRFSIDEPFQVVSKGVGTKGSLQGVYRWVVKGKFNLYYMNDKNLSKPFVQNVDCTVLVLRESFYSYPKGISIGLVVAQ